MFTDGNDEKKWLGLDFFPFSMMWLALPVIASENLQRHCGPADDAKTSFEFSSTLVSKRSYFMSISMILIHWNMQWWKKYANKYDLVLIVFHLLISTLFMILVCKVISLFLFKLIFPWKKSVQLIVTKSHVNG